MEERSASSRPPAQNDPTDLLARRPASHIEGIFPERYLGHDETLLYATRPSFVGYALPRVTFGIVGTVVLGLLLWGLQNQAGLDQNFMYLAIVLLAVVLCTSVAGTLVGWWYTCYALTTSRILVKHGAYSRIIIDIPHGAVQSVVFSETGTGRSFGYGNLQFSSASVGGSVVTPTRSRPGVVNWNAVPNPLEARAFYESVKKSEIL
jgi:membrane protein YdbS with pleckstrin-like domain